MFTFALSDLFCDSGAGLQEMFLDNFLYNFDRIPFQIENGFHECLNLWQVGIRAIDELLQISLEAVFFSQTFLQISDHNLSHYLILVELNLLFAAEKILASCRLFLQNLRHRLEIFEWA